MSPPPVDPTLRDLTAVLLSIDGRDAATLQHQVRRTVLDGNYGSVWLRMRPLPSLGLAQIELFGEGGMPHVDPALVLALAGADHRAVFIHYTKNGNQGVVHAFASGKQVEGWVGGAAEFPERFTAIFGIPFSELLAADDGTRHGIGAAASSTIALVRGRTLTVPLATPTMLGTFGFHDRAAGMDEGDRVALVAFDAEAFRSAWQTVTGDELAARIKSLPENVLGPLAATRDQVVATFAALGDDTPESAELRSVHAAELAALSESYVFAAGEATTFVDGRVLPIFSLTADNLALGDAAEAEQLEQAKSVLAAMVEVLPFRSPEGTMFEQLEDNEVRPLAPWARPGEEYVGSVFMLHGDRVRQLLGSLNDRTMADRVESFYRAWWQARTGEPEGVAYENWHRQLDERGAPDVQRFLTALAEWRTVLELAHKNSLQPALVFYG